jgi:hypothetical protein
MPPLDPHGIGYSLHFDNIAIGKEKSSNDIGTVTVQPFPYNYIKSIRFTTPESKPLSVFVNAQNYDRGWLAYETPNQLSHTFPLLFGKQLKEHVLVNNWANGWILENQSTTNSGQQVTVVFWPQYLEYIGFGLLALAFLYLLRSRKHGNRE